MEITVRVRGCLRLRQRLVRIRAGEYPLRSERIDNDVAQCDGASRAEVEVWREGVGFHKRSHGGRNRIK